VWQERLAPLIYEDGRTGNRGVAETMAMVNVAEFFREVRQELSRVTWPSRKETVATTAMVFVVVFLAAAFFFLCDQVFSVAVRFLFGLGR
jgi:preprotein translocase subunit SecE